jgi:hypothetical protein
LVAVLVGVAVGSAAEITFSQGANRNPTIKTKIKIRALRADIFLSPL